MSLLPQGMGGPSLLSLTSRTHHLCIKIDLQPNCSGRRNVIVVVGFLSFKSKCPIFIHHASDDYVMMLYVKFNAKNTSYWVAIPWYTLTHSCGMQASQPLHYVTFSLCLDPCFLHNQSTYNPYLLPDTDAKELYPITFVGWSSGKGFSSYAGKGWASQMLTQIWLSLDTTMEKKASCTITGNDVYIALCTMIMYLGARDGLQWMDYWWFFISNRASIVWPAIASFHPYVWHNRQWMI